MRREYGVSLPDLWRGKLTLRQVRVYLDGLPVSSRTAYTLAGETYAALAGWTLTDLLLGRVLDELSAYRWQWEAAHIDPKKTRHRPQPPSVVPELRESQDDSNVIPLVSPHRLGGFVNEEEDRTNGV